MREVDFAVEILLESVAFDELSDVFELKTEEEDFVEPLEELELKLKVEDSEELLLLLNSPVAALLWEFEFEVELWLEGLAVEDAILLTAQV